MASTVNLQSILNALPQNFHKEMVYLWNRQSRLLGKIPVKSGSGKNAAFVVASSGMQAFPFADGYDVQSAEFTADDKLPAVLSWAQYRSSFSLTSLAVDAAASSQGGAEQLLDLFAESIQEASSIVMSSLNADLDVGPGTGSRLVGLQSALIASGTYAGIDVSANPLMASNVTTSVGTLTEAKLADMETKIFIASGEMPDLIVMTPVLHQKYTTLGLGVTNNLQGVRAKSYNLSVRDDQLFWKDIPVIRDKDMASGTIKMLNSKRMHLQVLPPIPTKDSAVYMIGQGHDGFESKPIPIVIEALAKSGPSSKFMVRTPAIQLVVTKPSAHGLMSGVTV